MQRYLAIRLAFNLVAKNPQLAAKVADTEIKRNCHITQSVASALADEAAFFTA
jgi:hypothetical protein